MTSDLSDHRADIYALTCVMHECLTGSQPFPGNSLEQQLGGHLAAPPPRPSTMRAGVPTELDSVIAKGMAKKPEDRYNTTKELTAAARAAVTGPISRPVSGPPSGAVSGPVSGPVSRPRPSWPTPPPQPGPASYPPAPHYRAHSPSTDPTQVRQAPFLPPQAGPGIPPYSPVPAAPQERKNYRWLWAGLAAAVVVAVVAVAVTVRKSGPDDATDTVGTTTTSVVPVVPAGGLDALLLSADAINRTMGSTKMASSAGHHPITNNPYQVSPAECRMVDTVEADTYAGSAFTESVEEQVSEDPSAHWVDQATARFPSAPAASAFVAEQAPKWSACANTTYTVTKSSGESKQWSSGPVSNTNGMLTAVVTGGNWRCQQAMTAANNVVVNVQACYGKLTDQAVRITNQIVAKVRP